MNKPKAVPVSAPSTTLEAYGRVADLADTVNALAIAGASELHALKLSPVAIAKLQEARQALLAAHREIELLVSTPSV